MLITIEEFRQRVNLDRDGLVTELQRWTGRYGTEEAKAWTNSLSALERAFAAPSFQPLHLYFGSRGNLALEYQLPASSSWCDVVLLGRGNGSESAVIIELKDWKTYGDQPGRAEGLITRHGSQELHPSDQVRGYTEYCRRFHSAVEAQTRVHGCVLFTGDHYTHAYTQAPNHQLARDYPIFTLVEEDVQQHFPQYFAERLSEPDPSFAQRFAEGRYRQDRGFVAQIGEQILSPKTSTFELLDNQRRAFALSHAVVDECLYRQLSDERKRRVVVVKGPPGSGKSAIAVRLWASLVTDSRLKAGDVVFTTTSQSQSSNWSYVFDQLATEGGAGVVRKATSYTPISTARLGALRRKHGEDLLSNATNWRGNLELLRNLGEQFRDGSEDFQNLVTIVDEAHALINPEQPEGRGQFGFVVTLGPQAYHIIRTSAVSVFFLDPLQGFRQRENTTIEQIRTWARELGAGEIEEVSLEGAQFRCAGSAEYVSWLESLLAGAPIARNQVLASAWREGESGENRPSNIVPFIPDPPASELLVAEAGAAYHTRKTPHIRKWGRNTFEFEAFSNPESLEEALRARAAEGCSVRLLATYSRKWKTDGAVNPHLLPPSLQDFCETYSVSGKTKTWSRVWNFVPRKGSDYTWFIRGVEGSVMARDPLAEVGCPYAVRGFDYDYVGILWLNDLVYRDGEWQVNPGAVFESGVKALTTAVRKELAQGNNGPASKELLDRVAQAYRILFTRALRGVYVWIPDEETRQFVTDSMRVPQQFGIVS